MGVTGSAHSGAMSCEGFAWLSAGAAEIENGVTDVQAYD
jgi:hypothetical protein